jgi:hypothetical protein
MCSASDFEGDQKVGCGEVMDQCCSRLRQLLMFNRSALKFGEHLLSTATDDVDGLAEESWSWRSPHDHG